MTPNNREAVSQGKAAYLLAAPYTRINSGAPEDEGISFVATMTSAERREESGRGTNP